MCRLKGSVSYPFDQQVKDTIKVHGYWWSLEYYTIQCKLPAWEWLIFAGHPEGMIGEVRHDEVMFTALD